MSLKTLHTETNAPVLHLLKRVIVLLVKKEAIPPEEAKSMMELAAAELEGDVTAGARVKNAKAVRDAWKDIEMELGAS